MTIMEEYEYEPLAYEGDPDDQRPKSKLRIAPGDRDMPWGPYVSAGEEEEALFWLEKAVEARNQNMPYIGVGPAFELLHELPRFRELAERIGVPILAGPGAGD